MMRNYLNTAAFLLTAVVTQNASAALVDHGTYTSDTVSGLDWLGLRITDAQPYDSAPGLNPGWRYPTNAEVEHLFSVLFAGYYNTNAAGFSHSNDDEYADQALDVDSFTALFGITGSNASADLSWGFYEDEGGVLRILGVTDFFNGTTIVYGPDYSQNHDGARANGSPLAGVYLVRQSAVPIPAAAWLFVSGLVALIGIGRRQLRNDNDSR